MLSTANKTLAKGSVGSNARKSVRKIEPLFCFARVFARCMSIGLMNDSPLIGGRYAVDYLEVPEHPLLAQFFFRVHDFFHYRFISFHDS